MIKDTLQIIIMVTALGIALGYGIPRLLKHESDCNQYRKTHMELLNSLDTSYSQNCDLISTELHRSFKKFTECVE